MLRKIRSDHTGLWDANFQKLLVFRERNNHCIVPCFYDADPSLARWVKRQRHHYYLLSQKKPSPLKKERIQMLNRIGFVWNAKEALWQERLRELLDFKSFHGHCSVPTVFPSNQRLATWVKCQRRQHKLYQKGCPSFITPKRIMTLESYGFEWNARSPRPEKAIPDRKISMDSQENTRWLDIIMSSLCSPNDDVVSYDPLRCMMEEDPSPKELEEYLSEYSDSSVSTDVFSEIDDCDSSVSTDIFSQVEIIF